MSLVGESSEAAQVRIKKEFEESSFEVEKKSMRDYIARAKTIVIKLEQNNVNTAKKEVNRRILNDLPSDFDVEKKMFLLITDTDPDELGEALARVENSRMSNGGAGGTHALATGVKPRGGGPGRGGRARRDRGGRGNARARRDGKGHQPHHQQQWASQPPVQYQQQWASQPPAQQQRRRSISGSHSNLSGSHSNSSGSHSSSSNDHQDILSGGDHRVFVSVAASPDISMQNVELYNPRR